MTKQRHLAQEVCTLFFRGNPVTLGYMYIFFQDAPSSILATFLSSIIATATTQGKHYCLWAAARENSFRAFFIFVFSPQFLWFRVGRTTTQCSFSRNRINNRGGDTTAAKGASPPGLSVLLVLPLLLVLIVLQAVNPSVNQPSSPFINFNQKLSEWKGPKGLPGLLNF